MLEDAPVEGLEALAVVEVAQVRQLMAERVDEARVLERPAGRGMEQPDADRAVAVADAEPALHLRSLGLDHPIAEAEDARDAQRVAFEFFDQHRVISTMRCARGFRCALVASSNAESLAMIVA